MKQEGEVKRRNLYGSAVRSGSAREQLAKAPELLQTWKDDYSKAFEELSSNVEHYGGISKLEDESSVFASKLRESEERLKNDLGGRSFFKKRMDIGKYWDAGLLGEFGDFEGVVGTHYAKFIGDVYAKLDKKGDVLVNCKRKVGFGEGIVLPGIMGVAGAFGGSIFGGLSEAVARGLLAMERGVIEPGSNSIYAGAMVGGIGAVAFMYHTVRGRFNTFMNPLSAGADDLEKRADVIREALGCRIE